MAYQPTAEDKSMGMVAHLLALLTSWVGPLILYLVKKDESPWIRLHAKQALVWSVALAVIFMVGIPLIAICIGVPIVIAAAVVGVVYPILGMIKANNGEKFLYPVVAEWFCKDEIAEVYGGASAVPVASPLPPQTPPPPPPPPPSPSSSGPASSDDRTPPSPSA